MFSILTPIPFYPGATSVEFRCGLKEGTAGMMDDSFAKTNPAENLLLRTTPASRIRLRIKESKGRWQDPGGRPEFPEVCETPPVFEASCGLRFYLR